MMKIFSTFIALCFFLMTASANSEIYSWVDKEGKKHYGEKVPKEYLKQSIPVEVKSINSMDATKVSKTPTQRTTETDRSFVQPSENNNSKKLSQCEMLKQAYANSVSCFETCRNREGRYVNNVAACSHCQDLKKPDCR